MRKVSVACIMSTTRKNDKWLTEAINSIIQDIGDKISIDIFLYHDGVPYTPMYLNSHGIICMAASKRHGVPYSHNRCITEILKSGVWYDYIIRMDDDDISVKGRIQKQIDFLETNDYDFCGTRMSLINEKGDIFEWKSSYGAFDSTVYDKFFNSEKPVNNIIHGSVMFKSWMLYEGILFYNPIFRRGADYELWLRLLSYGMRFGVVDEALYLYRTHGNQVTSITDTAFIELHEGIFKFYKNNQKNCLHYQ